MSISQNIFCRVKLISQYSAVARRDPSLSDSLQITEPVTVLYYPPRRPVPSVYCTVHTVQYSALYSRPAQVGLSTGCLQEYPSRELYCCGHTGRPL